LPEDFLGGGSRSPRLGRQSISCHELAQQLKTSNAQAHDGANGFVLWSSAILSGYGVVELLLMDVLEYRGKPEKA